MTSIIDAGDTRVSDGYLPMAALEHPGATAIGLLDLHLPLEPVWPGGLSAADGAVDQLLLVRLHGQPVAIAHIGTPPSASWEQPDIEALWSACGAAIIDHVRQCACMPEPHGADELLRALAVIDPPSSAGAPESQLSASVVIATTGRHDLLARCIDSLIELQYPEFEVVVVDNRPSVAGTRDLVESYKSRASILYVAEPRQGLSIARNAGIKASSGDVVAFTDDDVAVDKLWLAELLAPFADQRVGAVTGLVLPLTLASPVQKRFELYAGFGKGLDRHVYDSGEHRASRLLYPYWGGMFGSGNSMAFRASALNEIGGFDPALGAGTPTGGGEDIAAFSDVILAGNRIVYEPRSLCWHEHRIDEDALASQIYNYGVGFTAVLWRYLTHDPRFLKTAVGSVPLVLQLLRKRTRERSATPIISDELPGLEAKGRLVGPWRYMRSRIRARRVGAL